MVVGSLMLLTGRNPHKSQPWRFGEALTPQMGSENSELFQPIWCYAREACLVVFWRFGWKRGEGWQPPIWVKDTVDGSESGDHQLRSQWRFVFFSRLSNIPGGFLAGFLNHQQYHRYRRWMLCRLISSDQTLKVIPKPSETWFMKVWFIYSSPGHSLEKSPPIWV